MYQTIRYMSLPSVRFSYPNIGNNITKEVLQTVPIKTFNTIFKSSAALKSAPVVMIQG